MTRIFIAGAGGFIGSHLQEHIAQTTDWEVCNTNPDYVVHLAGCSQIDKSISEPVETVRTDIGITLSLLEVARQWPNLKKFLYFSSDEVFGPKEVVCDFNAWDRYNSHSPYAAGKAACEELCLAWASTYGVPTVITHCQNLIGERQPANKFLPTVVRAALTGQTVALYTDGKALPRRNFLHVRDACSAIVLLLERGKIRDKYNIASEFETTSDVIVEAIETILHVEIKCQLHLTAAGTGHGINGSKLQELGWMRKPFMQSLMETVLWMVKPENKKWIGL